MLRVAACCANAALGSGCSAGALVAVAAILVASVRLHFLNVLLHLRWRGPNEIPCDHRIGRGEELGWFQHGSTIIVFAPKGFTLCDSAQPGSRVRMGERLLQIPRQAADTRL